MKNTGSPGTRHRLAAAWIGIAIVAAALAAGAAAAPLEELRASVKEFTLDNGLHFLVVEKPDAPVFSYATCVDAGGVCEVTGTTGIAHMFEHMAFKGTPTVGTSDYNAERKAMAVTDAAWDAYRAEKNKRFQADSTKLVELMATFRAAMEREKSYVVQNDFDRILETNGARNVNAFTATDMTCFMYSLPSNRAELWARMEGDRLAQPVLREFYQERDVVRNERRIGESSPVQCLYDDFITTAFVAHPYGYGVIGHASDIEAFSRRDAQAFFDKYYVAPNMTICIVGDVTVDQVHKLAEQYFRHVRVGPNPPPVITVEPVHHAELRVTSEGDANPTVIIGWQCPAQEDPDYAPMELVMEILGSGRSSRLYERLVKKEQVASQVGAGTDTPGSKYENQAVVFVFIAAGRDPEEAEGMVYDEVDRLITEGPTAEELQKVKTGYVARTIRQLRQPQWLAIALASSDQMLGDWRGAFDHLGQIEAVTAADIQRLAKERLTKERRTVAMLKKKTAGEEAGS
jgi:predicted Zn-dependent peptidase